MGIDEILEMMDDMLDKAVNVPFSNKKSLIDVEKMRELIDEIRLNMPREIKQAHDLVNDRKAILNNAKNEAAAIVQRAEQRASALVAQQEIVRQRTNTLMLQIRPHFVYNTLTSIYCLIDDDPAKAKEVTDEFTNYLRNNFTAIAQDKPIAFTKELEHTKAYLAVEQARFEGQLFFEFDTPVINFRLPALTLQPIVENAVKHGRDPELDPLYISVITNETENGVEISVIDSGPGFGEIDNDEPHIALNNIRERLEMMCNGTLTIAPREVGGTVVTVFIPKSKISKKRTGE